MSTTYIHGSKIDTAGALLHDTILKIQNKVSNTQLVLITTVFSPTHSCNSISSVAHLISFGSNISQIHWTVCIVNSWKMTVSPLWFEINKSTGTCTGAHGRLQHSPPTCYRSIVADASLIYTIIYSCNFVTHTTFNHLSFMLTT